MILVIDDWADPNLKRKEVILMTYEAPEVVMIGAIESVVLGPGEMDLECGCSRYLFMEGDLIETLDAE